MEGEMMSAAHPTAPARSYSMMSPSLSAGCFCITGETRVDRPTSLARHVMTLARRPRLRQCLVAKLVWFGLLGFMLAITAGMVQ
jgi:hypothetical protein